MFIVDGLEAKAAFSGMMSRLCTAAVMISNMSLK